MKRIIVGTLAAATLLLAGCGSSDVDVTPVAQQVDTVRAERCEAFAFVAPGVIEIDEADHILQDPTSTQGERSTALKSKLDEMSVTDNRTRAYDCNDPRDADLFARWADRYYDE